MQILLDWQNTDGEHSQYFIPHAPAWLLKCHNFYLHGIRADADTEEMIEELQSFLEGIWEEYLVDPTKPLTLNSTTTFITSGAYNLY